METVSNNNIQKMQFHWHCYHTWRTSIKNTLWCLLGCSIGDFGTILFFQINNIGSVSYTHLRAQETKANRVLPGVR